MTTLRFDLPLPPNKANERGHWAVRYKRRNTYWKHLDMLVTIKRNPPPPTTPWTAADATVRFRLFNTMDRDNLTGRCKEIFDWLVSRGYVVGDRPEQMRFKIEPTQAIDRRNPGVELVLEEAA